MNLVNPDKFERFMANLGPRQSCIQTGSRNRMGCSERQRELRRRRHRRAKVNKLAKRAEKASASEKERSHASFAN
jgi:hypothetical protein